MHEEPDEPPPIRFVLDLYQARFGEMPPMLFWHGRDEHLIALMEAAIEAGKALSQDDLIIAQGMKPGPDDAIY
jgi:hypothetical protein